MLLLHGFLTKSFNELWVFGNFIDFLKGCFVDLIFDISTNLSLKLKKFSLLLFDSGTDVLSILVSEVFSVPSSLLLGESLSNSPKSVPDVELLLKISYFLNRCRLNLKSFLISLVLVKSFDTCVKLLFDSSCFINCFLCWSILSNQKFRSSNFLHKCDNLLGLFSQFLLKLFNIIIFCFWACIFSTKNKCIDFAKILGDSFNLSLKGTLSKTLETFFLTLIFWYNSFHFLKFFLLINECLHLIFTELKVIDISYVSLKITHAFCKDVFDFCNTSLAIFNLVIGKVKEILFHMALFGFDSQDKSLSKFPWLARDELLVHVFDVFSNVSIPFL